MFLHELGHTIDAEGDGGQLKDGIKEGDVVSRSCRLQKIACAHVDKTTIILWDALKHVSV